MIGKCPNLEQGDRTQGKVPELGAFDLTVPVQCDAIRWGQFEN